MRVTTRAQLAIAFPLGISFLGLLPALPQGLRPGGLAGTLLAQNAPPRPGPAARNLVADGRNDDDLAIDGVFLPPDRASKRRLENAQQLLAEGRSGEAVRLLSAVLEASEDYFYKPNADQPVYRSLKAEAARVLSSLSGDARQAYELQSGARARQMLKQSAASGNLNELAEVSRRFFSTQAGWEATFVLGRKHLDENRPLAAAMCFERLCEVREAQSRLEPALSLSLAAAWMRADRPTRAKEALARLKRTYPKSEVIVAGKPVKLFASDETALTWFDSTFGHQQPRESGFAESWTLARGDETRNAASQGGRPLLNLRWRQRTADDRAVEKFVGKMRHDLQSQDAVALPSFQPLAIGDVVLMRTAFATQAVDFATGKLVWKYPSADDSLDQFLKVGSQPQQGQSVQLFSGLAQRMWDDAVYGTMASDGANVYYVDDLGLGLVGSPGATILHNGRRANLNTNPRSTNVLAARELKTQGKLRWQVGGATGEDEPKLAGAFFLGPPLPLSGQLYAMAELKGQEIRLVALSAETGALEWSQQLAVVEQAVSADSMRRNAGATPSFADGVLVCPTSAGAVVGFDLATRSLLWGYQYPRFQGVPDRFNAVRFGVHNAQDRQAGEHWADSTVTLTRSPEPGRSRPQASHWTDGRTGAHHHRN